MMDRSSEMIALRSGPGRPVSPRRTASIKETGEEVPLEQWERFEAAVGIAKVRSRETIHEPRHARGPR